MLRIGSLEIERPVIVASGPLTSKVSLLKRAQEAGAGAVALKLTFVSVPFPGQMRSYSLPGQTIVSPIDNRLNVDQGCELARQGRAQTDLVLFANLGARGTKLDEWTLLAERFAEAGVHGLELNFCCPNLDVDALQAAQAAGKSQHGGSQICEHPEQCYTIVERVKRAVDLPVICKYMPTSSTNEQVAIACADAGADAVHLVGQPAAGLPPIDPATGRPDMPLVESVSWGGSNGPLCRYCTYMFTAQAARVVDIPIIASGGISDWRDAMSVLMWGASAPSVCSAIMWHGWRVLTEMQEGLTDFLEQRGLTDWTDLSGQALPMLTTPDKMVLQKGSSRVVADDCIGCGRCMLPGHCEAIEMVDGHAQVDPDACQGCGVCQRLCPTGAIEFAPTSA